MTSADCKKYLASLHGPHLTWKRVRKFKEAGVVVREFLSNAGQTVFLAEVGGSLHVHVPGTQAASKTARPSVCLGHPMNEAEALDFLLDSLRADPKLLFPFCDDDEEEDPDEAAHNKQVLAHAQNHSSWDGEENLWTGREGEDEIFFAPPAYEKLSAKDVRKSFLFFMPYYDTAYRFCIYQDKGGHLYVSENEPD